MSKIIKEGAKFKFNIEIELSEQQLKWLCEYGGDEDYDELEYYEQLTADNYDEPVTLDPTFDMGLGADINSILSYGFTVFQHLDPTMKTKLSDEDLKYHPFMIKRFNIKSVEAELIDCQVETDFIPMTEAIDQNGNIVNVNDLCKD